MTFLEYRKPGFKVIPVLLTRDLANGVMNDVIGGTTIRQLVRPGEMNETLTPKEALAGVLRALEDPGVKAFVRKSRPPKLDRESFIEKELSLAGFNRTAFEALTGTLNADVQTDPAACERAAKMLVDADFNAACDMVERVNEILAAGATGYACRLLSIANTLRPSWISQADALVAIARVRANVQAERTLRVGTSTTFAVSSLVRRAHGLPVRSTTKIAYLTDPGPENTLETFTRQLAEHLRSVLIQADPDAARARLPIPPQRANRQP